MTPETLFQRQLDYVFDRPITEPAWYFEDLGDEDYEQYEVAFVPNVAETVFVFVENLLKSPKTNLEKYSDDQVGLGLNFIFNSVCSDFCSYIQKAEIATERRQKLIHGLSLLFSEVFNERCAPALGSLNESNSKLNYICYMFWDVTPLSYWGGAPKAERKNYYQAIASVMKKCLILRNPACVESGLHGLGHMILDFKDVAAPIIDEFLRFPRGQSPAVVAYAQQARKGAVQ